MGERRGAYRVLAGKPELKRPLKRTRCRWEFNVNIDIDMDIFVNCSWVDTRWQ